MDRNIKVDLHIHTCYSDGANTPSEIVLRYMKQGYDVIAITDHDTVDGVAEAMNTAAELTVRACDMRAETAEGACGVKQGWHKRLSCGSDEHSIGISVIPGIEFSTRNSDGVEMHILGYGIDTGSTALLARLADIRDARRRRNEKLIRYLERCGYPLTYDELLVGKRGDYIGKPDFGRAMVRRGYLKEPHEIFTPGKYLEAPEAKKIKKDMIDTIEAIRLIHECGGISVLAHPAKIKEIAPCYGDTEMQHYRDLNKLLDVMIPAGLGGIEAYHSDHMWEQSQRYIAIAEERGLIYTKGSDYHGEDFKVRRLSDEMMSAPLKCEDMTLLFKR